VLEKGKGKREERRTKREEGKEKKFRFPFFVLHFSFFAFHSSLFVLRFFYPPSDGHDIDADFLNLHVALDGQTVEVADGVVGVEDAAIGKVDGAAVGFGVQQA
jgi:hypothetical protein